MDIWRWVHGRQEMLMDEGQTELVDYIDQISTHAINERFDLVDQVFNAALPICRSLEDKWLEVFFRHWRLQAHVLKNYDAKGLLPEAISLLDFSHAEDTRECPQRICSVQDLAACYGIQDGPGFAEERISVCQETLFQIDGSWPCYECVSGELISARIDSGQFDEAKADLVDIDAEISKFQSYEVSELTLTRCRLLIELGELDAAWDLIKEADNPMGGDSFRREREFLKTLVLCLQEKWEEAKAISPSFADACIAAQYFEYWTRIQMLMQSEGHVENTRRLRYEFHFLADKLFEKDAKRVAFNILHRLIDLCLKASEPFRAKITLAQMQTLSSGFNRDLGATSILRNLKNRVESISEPVGKSDFEATGALLGYEFVNESEEWASVETGLKEWPGDPELISRKTDILKHCFQKDAAFEILEEAYENHFGNAALESRFGDTFLQKHGFEKFTQKFPMDNLQGLSNGAIWNRGFKYVSQYEADQPNKAMEYLSIIESYWPKDVWLMGRIARLHIQQNNFVQAADYRRKQMEIEPENTNHTWDLLICATLMQDSDLVCELAEQLEINVQDNGRYPAEQQGSLRIQWTMPDGSQQNISAVRLGPALARLSYVSRFEHNEQLYGRIVVIDPSPINRLDQKDDEGYACDLEGYYNYLYPAPLHTLEDPQHKTYPLDGVYPDKDKLQKMLDSASEAGFIYQERSTDQYRLSWQEEHKERDALGLYYYFLIKNGEQARLNQMFLHLNKEIKHPLIWPELATDLEDVELLRRHKDIADKYGIR